MNVWDILLILLLLAAVAWAAVHLIRVKKRGGTGCGGNCANCPACCSGKAKK